jgi:hypothetical protein
MYATRRKRPAEPNPSGLCMCGCGQPTPLAVRTTAARNQIKGLPIQFIHGHNTRVLKPEQTSQWKGGRVIDGYGYIRVRMPEHHMADRDGYVLEHRLVYEQSRGVRLPGGVVVHHINGVKTDNRPENLEAFTQAEHMDAHHRANRLATQLAGIFLDDVLLDAVKAYVREHGRIPDIDAIKRQLHYPTAPDA